MIYAIPDATLKTYESYPKEYDVTEAYKQSLADGFTALLLNLRTKAVVDRCMAGYSGKFIDCVTEEETAEIVDQYYKKTVPAGVEVTARSMVGFSL